MQDDEMVCSDVYEHSILWSQTIIQNEDDRMPRLEDFLRRIESKS
jgi:hypothetical protein